MTADWSDARETLRYMLREAEGFPPPPFGTPAAPQKHHRVEALGRACVALTELHQLVEESNITAKCKALASPDSGEHGESYNYLLGQVDILKIVRRALGIPSPANEPKLYIED